MTKQAFPLAAVYGLLEPGPVLLLSTAHKGKANVIAMSWYPMIEFEPPLVGCVVSNGDFSFTALKATRQCVLNIPAVELATQVDAPRIAERFANLECRVVDTRLVNRYNFFVLEVVHA